MKKYPIMSLRRLIIKFAHPTQFYSYTSWTSEWKRTPYIRQCLRAAHACSSQDPKQNPQVPPGISFIDVINQVIPPHELPNSRTITEEDWRSNRDSFKNANMFRSILQELGRRKLYDAGKSYIEMIKKCEPQLLTPFSEIYILRFLIHCSENFHACGNEEDIKYILSTFRKIRKAFPVLDYFSAETLFLAMQKTSEWKVALEILDDLSILQKPKAIVFSSIIWNALKENEVHLAWTIIDKMRALHLCPHDECWIQWLQLCRQSSVSEWSDGVGRMLEYFYTYHIQMSCAVADELTKYIEELCPNYSIQQSIIEYTKCSECATKLHSEFNSVEHANLKEMVEKIICHDSLYASTTPVEMQKFKTFIENCLPYDMVIDGLNAIYVRGSFSVDTLVNLKRRFNIKFLFLGRKHLTKKKEFRDIANVCQVFLCDNLSRDDVYVLYAAIYHGPHVKFISDDKMRSQLYYLVDDDRRNLFLRWQHMNQGFVSKLVVQKFPKYLPEIHKTGSGIYHIPCVDKSSTDLTWTPAEPQYWLCIRPGPKTKTKKDFTSAIPTRVDQTLFELDSGHQVNADGTTIVDDLVKRLQECNQLSEPKSSESSHKVVEDVLTRKEPIKSILKGFQQKYRREKRENSRRNTSTWLSVSLCQKELRDKDVVTNLKRRFQQMHDAEVEKNVDSRNNFPDSGNER